MFFWSLRFNVKKNLQSKDLVLILAVGCKLMKFIGQSGVFEEMFTNLNKSRTLELLSLALRVSVGSFVTQMGLILQEERSRPGECLSQGAEIARALSACE